MDEQKTKLGQALFIDQPLATHVWSNCNDGPGDITPIVCICLYNVYIFA